MSDKLFTDFELEITKHAITDLCDYSQVPSGELLILKDFKFSKVVTHKMKNSEGKRYNISLSTVDKRTDYEISADVYSATHVEADIRSTSHR